jgi:hypothetical protein
MKKIFKLIAIILLAVTIKPAVAQEVEGTPTDTLASAVNKLQSAVELLQRFKVTGYLQVQSQFADSAGIKSFAGGDFGSGIDKRFMVRRGRLKFAYNTLLTQFVAQFDVTEKGFATKDIYMVVRDPWNQTLSVTGGVFNRPFGYEIAYSSSSRESPERSRFTQSLFPGERDLGFMLTIQAPKTSQWNILKIQGGWFAGNGINPETDKKKDFIGQISLNKALFGEKVKLGLGASIYSGGVQQVANVYKMSGSDFAKDATITKNDFAKRQYFGLDGQVSAESSLGLTTLRGEYVTGKQPSTSTSPSSFQALPTGDLYLRDVKGAYVYFIQAIKGSKHSFVVKYDMFDPNTKVSGNQIGSITTTGNVATNAGDLKYTTTGLGWIYAYDATLKLMCYYDIVKNETSNSLKGYSKDLKDNVFTIRLQYKF